MPQGFGRDCHPMAARSAWPSVLIATVVVAVIIGAAVLSR
jgi:hypothetical protein